MTAEIVDRGDGPKIAGTRISIYAIFEYLEAGWDRESIALWLGIGTAQVEAGERYIDARREEVAAEFRKIRERIERGNPPELQAKLDATHERFMEKVRVMRAAKANSGNRASHAGNSCGQ